MEYYFTVCTRFNNKMVHGIVEFVDYHYVVGAEHFFLVCTDLDLTLSLELLNPYIDKGLVTLLHYPIDPSYYDDEPWVHCYHIATVHAQGKCRWMAYLDIDEFILPMKVDSVSEFLRGYEDYSAVAVNWLIFGTSGFVESPKSQLECLVFRAENNFSVHQHVKCIADPLKFNGMNTPHHVLTTDEKNVNPNYEFCYGPLSDILLDKIRINHYVIKSCEDYKDEYLMLPYKNDDFFNHHDRNEVYDNEIWRRFGKKILAFRKSIHSATI